MLLFLFIDHACVHLCVWCPQKAGLCVCVYCVCVVCVSLCVVCIVSIMYGVCIVFVWCVCLCMVFCVVCVCVWCICVCDNVHIMIIFLSICCNRTRWKTTLSSPRKPSYRIYASQVDRHSKTSSQKRTCKSFCKLMSCVSA